MALENITDLAARAAARVLSQYRSKPRFMALLNGINGLTQEVEDALWAIVAQLDTSTAQGVWLDFLGDFVGEARAGVDDAAYRIFIEARILANKSQGTVEDIIGVIKKVTSLNAFQVQRQSPASLEVVLPGYENNEPTRTRLRHLLRATRAGGVKLMVISTGDPANDFVFGDSAVGIVDDPDHGLGDVLDPDAGGALADAIDP